MPYFQPGARSRGAVRRSALSGIGDLVSGIYNVGTGILQGQGAAAYNKDAIGQQQASGTPSWLLPVGIVAGLGIVAVVVMKKRG